MARLLCKWLTLLAFTGFQLLLPSIVYASPATTALLTMARAGGGALVQAGALSATPIGGTVLGMSMANWLNEPPAGGEYDCMVAVNPSCLPAPANWSRDGNGQPTPPAKIDNPSSPTAKQSAGSAECKRRWGPDATFNGGIENSIAYAKCEMNGGTIDDLGPSFMTKPSPTPAGYACSDTNSPCALTDASQVRKPDGIQCSVIQSGNSFSYDASNPACDNASNGAFTNSNGTFSVISSGGLSIYPDKATADAKGNPLATAQASATGTTVKQYDPASNTTTTTTINGGKVIGQSTEAGNTTGTNTGTGGGTKPEAITCESVGTCDVAKDGTVKSIGTSLTDFFKNFTTVVQIPQLYKPTGKTMKSAFDDYRQRMNNAPFIAAVSNFFTVQLSSVSCPVWTIPSVSVMGKAIGPFQIDQFCSPVALNVYRVMAAVVNVVAAFFAFRIAIE
ncbi:hypothetical protein HZU77_016610 [Neisseriaceae bacterium TC5R-5]|nr:hypothetical protein [Neisseriaceae bacterium TC5R-5]